MGSDQKYLLIPEKALRQVMGTGRNGSVTYSCSSSWSLN